MSEKKLSAAEIEANNRFPLDAYGGPGYHYNKEEQDKFLEGANWQKEQDKELANALLALISFTSNIDNVNIEGEELQNARDAVDNYLNQ